jgi:hypothetical protein
MPIDIQLFDEIEKMKETKDSPQKQPERTLTVESKKTERSDWIS